MNLISSMGGALNKRTQTDHVGWMRPGLINITWKVHLFLSFHLVATCKPSYLGHLLSLEATNVNGVSFLFRVVLEIHVQSEPNIFF